MSLNLAKLQAAIAEPEDKPPKDFKTANEWAEAWDVSPRKARELLNQTAKKGLVEVRTFKRRSGGQLRPVPHYGPKR